MSLSVRNIVSIRRLFTFISFLSVSYSFYILFYTAYLSYYSRLYHELFISGSNTSTRIIKIYTPSKRIVCTIIFLIFFRNREISLSTLFSTEYLYSAKCGFRTQTREQQVKIMARNFYDNRDMLVTRPDPFRIFTPRIISRRVFSPLEKIISIKPGGKLSE